MVLIYAVNYAATITFALLNFQAIVAYLTVKQILVFF